MRPGSGDREIHGPYNDFPQILSTSSFAQPQLSSFVPARSAGPSLIPNLCLARKNPILASPSCKWTSHGKISGSILRYLFLLWWIPQHSGIHLRECPIDLRESSLEWHMSLLHHPVSSAVHETDMLFDPKVEARCSAYHGSKAIIRAIYLAKAKRGYQKAAQRQNVRGHGEYLVSLVWQL